MKPKEVSELISTGANVNSPNKQTGLTPLETALLFTGAPKESEGRILCVAALLESDRLNLNPTSLNLGRPSLLDRYGSPAAQDLLQTKREERQTSSPS